MAPIPDPRPRLIFRYGYVWVRDFKKNPEFVFLMLRKAIANVGTGVGLRMGAADIVPAAELVEAECAAVRDTDGWIELRATPAGVEYMKMIDAVLAGRSGS
jgi:hypothetical protein